MKKTKDQFKRKKSKKKYPVTVDYAHPGKKQKGVRINPTTGRLSV